MPRPRDPMWDNFDRVPNPTGGKIDYAKCKLCDWRQIGLVDRLKNHFHKRHSDHPDSQQYTARTVSDTLDESSSDVGLQEKVTMLEETLKKFRAEVDMKMTIVEQVLTTRNELFTVQKKLLDREQALHENVLAHWKNIADLAASGLSLKFSDNTNDDDLDLGPSNDEGEKSSVIGKRHAARATLARRERRKRSHRTRHSGGDGESSEGDFGDDAVDDTIPTDFENVEDGAPDSQDDDTEVAVPKGLEKKVFVKFYSEEEPKAGERVTKTPVWKYYLREEHGESALCKLCDAEGTQSILKVRDCSTSSLHTHLKFKHNIIVEHNPKQHSNKNDTTTGDGGDEDFPPRPKRTRSGLGVIGRPPNQVWSYFTEFILDGQRKQQCLACGHLVSAQAPRLVRHYANCKEKNKRHTTKPPKEEQEREQERSFKRSEPEESDMESIPIMPSLIGVDEEMGGNDGLMI